MDILTRLALALGIGFLIGLERGWRERAEAEGERTAGLRTFTLIGLFGGISGLLSATLGPAPVVVAFVVLAGAATLFRWRETEREGTRGMTTLVAMFLTFWLGAYAALGEMSVAAAAGVATAVLLASKEWLHTWLRVLTWPELRAALILLAMTFIALPVLPDVGLGPYGALNPRDLWLMTIVIASVSFIGYVATKLAGERYGLLIAGIAGGLVSSTAVTLDFARRARVTRALANAYLSGAVAASAVMFARVITIVSIFGPVLLPALALPLAVAMGVSLAAALALNWYASVPGAAGNEAAQSVTNPFELPVVIGFALVLAVVLLLSRFLMETYGGGGGIVLAAVAGLADVDAITLSMTELANNGQSASAEAAIFTAIAANSFSKSVFAVWAGGARFGFGYAAIVVTALASGAAVLVWW